MNILKDYGTIHLQLIEIDMLEVVILLMIYLVEYAFQIKQRICKNVKYVTSIIGNSVIICDDITDTIKTVRINLNKKMFPKFTHLFINSHVIIDGC